MGSSMPARGALVLGVVQRGAWGGTDGGVLGELPGQPGARQIELVLDAGLLASLQMLFRTLQVLIYHYILEATTLNPSFCDSRRRNQKVLGDF